MTTYSVYGLALLGAVYVLLSVFRKARQRLKTTQLRGPPSEGFIYGATRQTRLSADPKVFYKEWVEQFGTAFRLPLPFGTEAIAICEPKAASSFFNKDTYGYVKTPGTRGFIRRLVGEGISYHEGESHKRQRKALLPAFSTGAIREMNPIFYHHANKIKDHWTALVDESEKLDGAAEIELNEWLQKLSLDTVGSAAFGHEFYALDGEMSIVEEVFRSFNNTTPSKSDLALQAMQLFVPILGYLPSKRKNMFSDMSVATRRILEDVLVAKKENSSFMKERREVKSALGLLIDTEIAGDGSKASREQVVAQMKTMLLAGTDPPAGNLAWALIKISQKPEFQIRLREELRSVANTDPTWDQLNAAFPLLDAVTLETLRLHPSILETVRIAAEDDVIQLVNPVVDATGKLSNELHIAKGTQVLVPVHYMNCLPEIWGPDSAEFNPDRWMNESFLKSANRVDSQAVRKNLWTFSEGPRLCMGRAFALTQMKIALLVLVREFTFELPRGPDTEIGIHFAFTTKPKVIGTDGAKFPLKVRRA